MIDTDLRYFGCGELDEKQNIRCICTFSPSGMDEQENLEWRGRVEMM